MVGVKERIEIDIEKFNSSVKKISGAQLTEKEREIVELSKMYASDCKSWLEKGDLYTSFCAIAYAHGLMDSILKIKGLIE
ncbi:MAG: DUF357 domain-containing protein [Candidatus Micrarchaeota archaeon]|nr:DUF357 domain-containing protein [Candidatus Micrarchaeota archaeon]